MALAKVPQELKEPDIPWQVEFTDTTKHSQVGLEQRKQALGSILMHVTARIFLLGVIDELTYIALQCPITAGRVGVEPTVRLHCDVRGLLHRLDGEIAGHLDNDRPLPTDPGDDRWSVFVIMPPAGLAFLPTATRSAPQRLLATAFRLPLVAGGVVEVIGFDRPCQLAAHLIGQGGIAQLPAPAIAGTDMDAHFPGNTARRTGEA